jgi:hypothetical protein
MAAILSRDGQAREYRSGKRAAKADFCCCTGTGPVKSGRPVPRISRGQLETGVNEIINEVGAAARTWMRRRPRKGEGLAGDDCACPAGRGVDGASRFAYPLNYATLLCGSHKSVFHSGAALTMTRPGRKCELCTLLGMITYEAAA